jgi:hypothetical protein
MKSIKNKSQEPDEDDDSRVYSLHLVTKLQLEDAELDEDPDLYTAIEGRVMFENGATREPIEVGKAEAHLIGMHRGADIRKIAYWHTDEDIEPLHACLFDRSGRMWPPVARLYGGDAFVDFALYVESIEVAIDHRGRDVGLKAMKALLRHFAHQVTLAFCKPYPIYRAGELRERGSQYFDPALVRVPEAQAAKALARYWARAGFTKFWRGPYYVTNLRTTREL